jgi:hypothetical protein
VNAAIARLRDAPGESDMLAVILVGLGDKAKSFQYRHTAYAQKSADLAYFIKADFRQNGWRSDPRFVSLAARVGAPSMAH